MEWLSYESLGYVASTLIVISLMMRSVLRLRLINLFGAGTMAIYGLLIQAYPVAVLNGMIVCIDIYYLAEMLARRDFFTLLQVRKNSRYLAYFLQYYSAEIRRFLPAFRYDPSRRQRVCFILRNLIPAGLFISEPVGKSAVRVHLDFVIPGYRDFKIGRFVYRAGSELLGRGVTHVYTEPGTPKHEAYLRRMGFRPAEQGAPCEYVLVLPPAEGG